MMNSAKIAVMQEVALECEELSSNQISELICSELNDNNQKATLRSECLKYEYMVNRYDWANRHNATRKIEQRIEGMSLALASIENF